MGVSSDPATASASAVELSGLGREYGELVALRKVTLDLGVGRTLAVLGPNGAGKSTLLRILAGLLRPTDGDVAVLGRTLPGETWRLRGKVGFLGHSPLLYRELTVRENLTFQAGLHGLDEIDQRIDRLTGALGLGRRVDELARNLSAGMLRRADVARALLHDPELLLLDEPYAHLDPAARELVESVLGPAEGRTRVIVSHEPESALAEADRVLVLGAGGRQVLEAATAEVSAETVRAVYAEGES